MWKNYNRDFLYLTRRQEEVNGMSWSIADSVCKAESLYTAKQSVKLTTPGGTPLDKLCRYVQPHRVGCWALLVWKQACTLPSLVWNRVWFLKELREWMSIWTYLSFQFQISKTGRELCEFEMDLKFFLFAL